MKYKSSRIKFTMAVLKNMRRKLNGGITRRKIKGIWRSK